MKKKILGLLLCMTMTMLFIGCGKSKREENAGANAVESNESEETVETVLEVDAEDAADLLTKVWNTFGEEEKFPIGGGDYDNQTSDVPGKFDVTKAEDMDSMLGFPTGSAGELDDAASMLHMMNANTFTAGAYHVTDSGKIQEIADALKENIMKRQWICGFPDKLIVASVGKEYLVSAFGGAENIEVFKTKLQAEYEMTEILYEENLE